MDKQIAAQLYLNKAKDMNVWLLTAWGLLQEADVAQVLASYQQILAGKIKVVSVKSSLELETAQKSKLESGIMAKFKDVELAFVYQQDTSVINGIEVSVGDDRIQFNN
jgi:F0F1-type ATP synthase delta subunit